ncbi:MAG: branched-chain amino acid aminotransferase [Cyclobacteriaceae bacterium]|nr:branched-chain amino acid aminotransferase [Cyclobacteriaceae bacterium]MCH8516074.1 branched-chain amino acid aminotransferase [Cyclobacteriaceae bacterium]
MIASLDIKIEKTKNSKLNQVDFDNIPFGKVYSDHMFVADYADGEWKDGRIAPYENLSLSPATSAIHYGQSVFEGLKAYKNVDGDIVVFRPQANAQRLNRSSERMCIPPVPEELFMNALNELLKLDAAWVPNNPNTALYIRPFVFATDEFIGIRPSDTYKFMIFTCPVGAYYTEPVNVKIETNYARAVAGGTGYAKAAGNYAGALYPAKQAQKDGYHQLIWTDAKSHEYIEESGTMNVMFIINDTILTAPTGDTILKGITRDSVLHLAKENGYKIEERPIKVKEIEEALKNNQVQEAFGTGTAATIAPIRLIGVGDQKYQLPAVEDRKFSKFILALLDDIKSGKAEDKHGWIYKVK